MFHLYSFLALLISSLTLCGCAARPAASSASWDFPVDGNVSSISRTDLAAAIAAADATRVYRVNVINRDRVRVEISGDLHEVGNYNKKGRYFVERFHGEPMYVVITRTGGKWECDGAFITTY